MDADTLGFAGQAVVIIASVLIFLSPLIIKAVFTRVAAFLGFTNADDKPKSRRKT